MRLRHTHPHNIRTTFHSIKEQNIYITTADWTRLCLLRSSDRMWRSRLLFLLVWYGQYGQLNCGSFPHSYTVWRLSVGLWRYAFPHLLQWNLLIEGDNPGCTLPSSCSSIINHDGGLLPQEVQSSSCSTDAEKTKRMSDTSNKFNCWQHIQIVALYFLIQHANLKAKLQRVKKPVSKR